MAYKIFSCGTQRLRVIIFPGIWGDPGLGKRFMAFYSYFQVLGSLPGAYRAQSEGLDYEIVPVHLVRAAGRTNVPTIWEINPLALVPALQTEGPLIRSLAIAEYLGGLSVTGAAASGPCWSPGSGLLRRRFIGDSPLNNCACSITWPGRWARMNPSNLPGIVIDSLMV